LPQRIFHYVSTNPHRIAQQGRALTANIVIYLLGIGHSFQIRTFKLPSGGGLLDFDIPLACRFETYLDKLVTQVEPQAICEEYSETVLLGHLEIDDRAYSIPKNVSAHHNIKHVFCDPNQHERDILYAANGTTEAEDERNGYPVREGEWLRRITSLLLDTLILFICGANHIATFKQKLEAKHVTVEVICRDLEDKWKHGY
jgi:hypothetical protein